jgi:hypothetical protein
MTNLDAASGQWATRPDHKHFLTHDDPAASVGARRDLIRASNMRLDAFTPCWCSDGALSFEAFRTNQSDALVAAAEG